MRPKGDVLHSGKLDKAGSGLLSHRFSKRHVVIHKVDGCAFLSVYADEALTDMKGSRLQLDGRASVQCDDTELDVFYVTAHDEKTSVAKETITQSYTSVAVTAKFKASSEDEASAWMQQVQAAIKGGE